MRPAEGDTSDCILVVGISRPKMAAAFLSVALLSLFLTFHVLYDSAVYSLHAASAVEGRAVELVSQVRAAPPLLFSSKVHYPRTSRHLPQAIIIGVRKCGTRALLEMLYLHPQIQKASGEVHFFDRDDNYGKGLEWYRRKMPYSFKGQITIEKSPSYFVTPEEFQECERPNLTQMPNKARPRREWSTLSPIDVLFADILSGILEYSRAPPFDNCNLDETQASFSTYGTL
ncbi:hypothetical protein HZH66_010042 [Vespula vulgaris]|uniref:Sulfotransferase domain-containing protein n=1 Tax=Vespula vulgaris TaxID=7454 RepID=A0A834MXH8_VESVU|nr:hypothetical protein HZH66_010042 [Vespula vulgaris]